MDSIYSTLSAPEEDTEEDKRLLSADEDDSSQTQESRWTRRYPLPGWLLVANGVIVCILCIVVTMTSLGLNNHHRNWLLKLTSQPSPLLEQIDIPLGVKKMNASLLDTSIWRQPPSPQVDAAWNRIQTREAVAISRKDVIAMGKDPSDAVKWPASFGFGEDAYVAKLDVLHQIHCLNTLRMNLRNNFDYYYGREFPGSTPTDAFHDLHVTHCVHVLLENLMCAGNVDLYTHTWIDAQTYPYADFNINHMCRDFDAILAWQEEHAVPMGKISELTKPDDYEVHVMDHEFKKIMHWYDDHPDDNIKGGGETG